MTKNQCTGTEALSVEEGLRIAAEEGFYAPEYRRMCATCHGSVMLNGNGKLRKHIEGSNRTALKK
jgi:hypothetical protein